MSNRILAALALGALVAACGPQTPEAARATAIAKCERQFGRMAPDPSQGEALCSCFVDDMAAEGRELTDVFGGGREALDRIMRKCAVEAGVPLPTG